MNKEIKLSYYIIPQEVIKKLKQSLTKSAFIDVETGGDFCVKENEREISIENECIGNKCNIIHKGECSEGKHIIGVFHNHPASIVDEPPIRDFLSAYTYGISCIGSVENNKIICYERIGNFIEKNFRTILEVDEKVGEILRNHENLTDKEFTEYYEAKQEIITIMKDKLFKSYIIFDGVIWKYIFFQTHWKLTLVSL